ncbi:MAG: right-handed parallel beta-helix repeat-containing protein [Lentisphaeria bacterium]|nr:right-handed parallel beta-helix repeat-containing protein [Lentisphaeria bacterium]
MSKMKYLSFLFCFSAILLSGAEELKTIDLSRYIRSRYKAGERDITLPDGKVKCRTVTLGKEFKDLTIRGGKNTVLICDRLVALFFLNGCKNVTLRDFAVDYDPLSFTQATVTKVDRKTNEVFYRLHDGYPRLSAPYLVKHPMAFDSKTRKMKFGTKLVGCKSNKKISDSEGVLTYNKTPSLTPGDMLVLNFRQDCVFKVRGMAENLKFINLTMYSGPGGIIARQVVGEHLIKNCRAIRGERPAGAAEERLLSLSADAVNYATGRKGPVVEGCEFSFIGDDSVNFHGRPMTVIKAEPEKGAFICATGGKRGTMYCELIFPGDRVRMLGHNNHAIKHTAKITKFEYVDADLDVDAKSLYPANPGKTFTLYRVYVDGKTLPEPGMLVDFPAINMPDYVIRNNYFHDHRARGVRIMGIRGVIENNRMERLEHQGISVGPEYGYWIEAGWVEKAIIRNNVIKSVCLGGSAYRAISYSPGAICTFVHNKIGDFGIYPGNKGVVIENNKIDNCSIAGIHLLASDGAIVRNNEISNVNWGDSSELGNLYHIQYNKKDAIGTTHSKNAVIENNKVK